MQRANITEIKGSLKESASKSTSRIRTTAMTSAIEPYTEITGFLKGGNKSTRNGFEVCFRGILTLDTLFYSLIDKVKLFP